MTLVNPTHEQIAETRPILYLDGVSVSFDGFKALNALSFYVEPGEMRAIIGPNGAGKTTMMDVITGKTRPDNGEVFLEGPPPEAVLINLAGDLTGGDCLRQTVDLDEGTHAVVTTQAAEKIYRASEGANPAVVTNKLTVKAAALEWLPQETIFFDGGRLHRTFEATLTEEARLLACEATIFGRTAIGETVHQGYISDDWGVTVDGRTVFADGFVIDGAIRDHLDRPAIARGNRALASVLYIGADAERLLQPVLSAVDVDPEDGGLAAVSLAIPLVLLARFIAPDGTRLRSLLTSYIGTIRAVAGFEGGLPKLWRC